MCRKYRYISYIQFEFNYLIDSVVNVVLIVIPLACMADCKNGGTVTGDCKCACDSGWTGVDCAGTSYTHTISNTIYASFINSKVNASKI